MSAEVRYPITFLQRDCDRLLGAALAPHCGGSTKRAAYHLYRMWHDYAVNGTDRREITAEEAAECQTALVIELASEWEGPRGVLVMEAIKAGFLKVVEGEKPSLQLAGFYPLNSPASRNAQRKGAYQRSVRGALRKASHDADNQVELWEQASSELAHAMEPGLRKQAVALVLQVCRCRMCPPPKEQAWQAGLLKTAADLIVTRSQDELDAVMRYVVENRASVELPYRPDLILADFKKYLALSKDAAPS